MKPLDKMTFKELRQYARDIGASSITRLGRRDELIRALKRYAAQQKPEHTCITKDHNGYCYDE